MTWSLAELRALEAIRVGASEAVYGFVSLEGEPSGDDEALLDEEERRRSRRFRRLADSRRFMLAHAALRLVLARCLGVDPTEVAYEQAVSGKPRLSSELPGLEFNLSHSGDLGLVAVTRAHPIGIDVERIHDIPDLLGVADAHFSAAERMRLRSLPLPERRDAFFYCWTRKEALVKAAGEGLGRPLDDFDVELAPGAVSVVRRRAEGLAFGGDWLVRDLAAPPGYAAAGAVAVPPVGTIEWRELERGVSGVPNTAL